MPELLNSSVGRLLEEASWEGSSLMPRRDDGIHLDEGGEIQAEAIRDRLEPNA
jgi:hypothetical protein